MNTDPLNVIPTEDNKIGQVFTPLPLAKIVVGRGLDMLSSPPSLILDPAVGPGVFIEAVQELRISSAVTFIGYDLDARMANLAGAAMDRLAVSGDIRHSDYLLDRRVPAADLIVMNPPYVRHELIEPGLKRQYAAIIDELTGARVPRRANLLVYFLLKAIGDVLPGGIVSAVVYDAVTRTAYGKMFLKELDRAGDVLSIEPVVAPFPGVLVNAEIIVIRKRFARSLRQASKASLLPPKHVLLSELVSVARGTALLNSRVFLAQKTDPYFRVASPFVKRQRLLLGVSVPASHTERAYLFADGNPIPPEVVEWLMTRARSVAFSTSLRTKGLEAAISGTDLSSWLSHRAVTAPILMNYYFRTWPRHILNPGLLPAADNFLCVHPKGIDPKAALALLNSSAWRRALVRASRSQGNGLRKLQVYEYRAAVVPDWRLIPPPTVEALTLLGEKMVTAGGAWHELIPAVDKIVRRILPRLDA